MQPLVEPVTVPLLVWRRGLRKLVNRLGKENKTVIVLSRSRKIQFKIWKSGKNAWTFQRKIGRVHGAEITVYELETVLRELLNYRHRLIGGKQPLVFEHDQTSIQR